MTNSVTTIDATPALLRDRRGGRVQGRPALAGGDVRRQAAAVLDAVQAVRPARPGEDGERVHGAQHVRRVLRRDPVEPRQAVLPAAGRDISAASSRSATPRRESRRVDRNRLDAMLHGIACLVTAVSLLSGGPGVASASDAEFLFPLTHPRPRDRRQDPRRHRRGPGAPGRRPGRNDHRLRRRVRVRRRSPGRHAVVAILEGFAPSASVQVVVETDADARVEIECQPGRDDRGARLGAGASGGALAASSVWRSCPGCRSRRRWAASTTSCA